MLTSLRAWLHGWRSVYHPEVTADHESGSTIKRSIRPLRRAVGTYRNRRLTHLALVLDPADLRDYARGELHRSLRQPYLWPAALTLLPRAPAAVRRRRALVARCGRVSVAELEARWNAGGH